MKRNFFQAAIIGTTLCALAALSSSCQKIEEPDTDTGLHLDIDYGDSIKTNAVITFSCNGDFTLTQKAMTRALTADGKDLTDVWVLDYMGDELKQQIHQTADEEDFGTPTLNLATGSHHLYFIASRGVLPTLDTSAKTITFATVRDTFYKDLALSVNASSSGSRNVTLDRCVTKLRIVISDAIPEGAATISMTPATWYYGINYLTGEPTTATPSQAISITIPPASIGQTNLEASIFGFSVAEQWTTDIAIACKASDESTLGSATITSAPFKANRITQYTGPLFSSTGATSLTLSTSWDDAYTATW